MNTHDSERILEALKELYKASAQLRMKAAQSYPNIRDRLCWDIHTKAMRAAEKAIHAASKEGK